MLLNINPSENCRGVVALCAAAAWCAMVLTPQGMADAAQNFTTGEHVASKFGVHEIVLKGSDSLSNPFDTAVTVQFTPPSGAANVKTVAAYYDGQGVWRARAYMSEVGSWKWSSKCPTEAGLHGKSGTFSCEPSQLRGRLLRHPQNPHQWMTENGRWFLNLNDTAYFWLSAYDGQGQPVSEQDAHDYVRDASDHGVTSLRSFLSIGPGGFAESRKSLSAAWRDAYFADDAMTRLELQRFQKVDDRLRWLLNEYPDMYLQVVLFPMGCHYAKDQEVWQTFSAQQKERLMRHIIARYAAYPQVFWLAVNDVHYGPKYPQNYAFAREVGEYFAHHDPWRHPFSTGHARGVEFAFPDEDWVTYLHLEHQHDLGATQAVRYASHRKPVFLGEDRYEQDHGSKRDPTHMAYWQRRLFWSWLLADGSANYGGRWSVVNPYRQTGTRAYQSRKVTFSTALNGLDSVRHIRDYFAQRGIELSGFQPNAALVKDSAASDGIRAPRLMARGKQEFLVYHPNAAEDGQHAHPNESQAASLAVDLRDAKGTYSVEWFRAADGVVQQSETISGGDWRQLTAPWKGQDCVVRLLALQATTVLQGATGNVRQANPVETSEFTAQAINVPEGFSVELAAAPPLVAHPTFATFDDRGRLFVSESAGLNLSAKELEEQLPNSIRLLEDTNRDGRFDKSTVFADKMTFPNGGAWHDGALYVASPPNIWRLADTDGDGVADQRDVLVGKFGFTGNAASIHGCIPGPDGRIYWCDGFHGHEFKDSNGQIKSKRIGSYIFSCLADGSDVRMHCGGGMDNPVEVDFTDEGEMLGTVNILYTRPRVDCLVHWLYGGAYPHREQVLAELKVTGDLLGPVHRFGHVAISGTTRYRSGGFDPRWRDNFFATFFNSGKVVRLEIGREGSTFRVTQREFLSCANRDFHPTDIAEDADGSLIVVDTGGWFYRGCPTSQFAKPDVFGALYRVRRIGAPPPIDPRGNELDWARLDDASLVAILGDKRFAVRERAISQSAHRGAAILPALRQTLQSGEQLHRLGAVWALTRMIGAASTQTSNEHQATWKTEARAAIRLALDDRAPGIRQAACRSLATYPDAAAVARLLELLQQDEPPIRREAATALGRIGDAKAVPVLLAALEQAVDRAQDHALVYALIEIEDAVSTRAGLAAKGFHTRRGALIALDQMDGGNLSVDEVLPFVAAKDLPLQGTAAEIFGRHASWKPHSSGVIARLLEHPSSVERNSGVIRKLTTGSLSDEVVAKLVGQLLGDTRTPAATHDLLLAAIADGRDVPLHPSWIEPLEKRLDQTGDTPATQRVLSAITAIKTDRFRDRLNRLGADASRPTLLRVAALEAASGKRGALTDSSLDLLIGLLDGGPADSLQAAQKIGGSGLSKPQLIRLAPKLSSAGPTQLQELISAYRRTQDVEVAKAFLTSMQAARSLTSLAPHLFSDVILRYPRELLPAANALLDRIRQAEEQKLARLDTLLPLLEQGNVARGRELFFAEKSKCAACHRVGNQGGKIGPDLTTIGANRAARDLLESIVFPSATIVRDYEPYSVVTTDGRALSGLIARETTDTLFLQQQIGDPLAIPRGEIDELAPSTVSLMPNGLEKALTEAELADVIAYLKSLKHPPAMQASLRDR